MSGKPAEQDNSIEEILASIRQIISEDEPKAEDAAPAPVPAAVLPEPEPEPVLAPEPEPVAATEEDVFELVDRVVAEEEPAPVEPEPQPEPEPEVVVALTDHIEEEVAPVTAASYAPPAAELAEGPIFGDAASAATLGAFAKLSETILLERQRAVASAVTLEDIVKELLAPLLRQWIDHHVPGMVERLVREELEKLARQAREG